MSNPKNAPQCYIYTRISTQMQAENHFLDAQREQLRREAERRGMAVAAEFSDVGPTASRPQFVEMMDRIQEGNPDGVAYVLVTKLSRFGRDTADVLNNLQIMEEHGVNLIVADEGIDSATAEGKLTFPVMALAAALGCKAIRA